MTRGQARLGDLGGGTLGASANPIYLPGMRQTKPNARDHPVPEFGRYCLAQIRSTSVAICQTRFTHYCQGVCMFSDPVLGNFFGIAPFGMATNLKNLFKIGIQDAPAVKTKPHHEGIV